MKTMLVAALLLLVGSAEAQYQDIWSDSLHATTTWQKVTHANGGTIYNLTVINDTTAGSAVLFVAFDDDTASGRYVWLRTDEGWDFPQEYMTHFWYKTSDGTIPFRYKYR